MMADIGLYSVDYWVRRGWSMFSLFILPLAHCPLSVLTTTVAILNVVIFAFPRFNIRRIQSNLALSLNYPHSKFADSVITNKGGPRRRRRKRLPGVPN